jgi:hypothetical protein
MLFFYLHDPSVAGQTKEASFFKKEKIKSKHQNNEIYFEDACQNS